METDLHLLVDSGLIGLGLLAVLALVRRCLRRGVTAQTRAARDLQVVWLSLVILVAIALSSSFIRQRHGDLIPSSASRPRFDIENIKTQLQLYETLKDAPPSTAQGLQALVTPPSGKPQSRHWRQLIPVVPVDPWGQPYHYRHPATKSQEAYDIFSSGPDKLPDTADDIGNW